MADQHAEPKKAAKDDEPEPTPYEAGEWVAAGDGTPPNASTLVYYSVPGQEPDVRLGSSDGEFYNDALTGRATPIADVGGFKSVMSEAPKDPGLKSKNQEAEKDAKDAPKAEAKK